MKSLLNHLPIITYPYYTKLYKKIQLIFQIKYKICFFYIKIPLNSIENQFNELIKKEEAQKESYRQQKAQLEAEVEDLKSKQTSREKLLEKLKVDSEVRWHRDKYKKILNNAETIYKNIDKSIAEKEKKIAELDTLLSIMN